MPNGSVYGFPAELVAKNRATYYADKEADPTWDRAYAREFEYTMSDTYELLDWFKNNMNWGDVKRGTVQVSSPQAYSDRDFQEVISCGCLGGDCVEDLEVVVREV
jgi:hypothetical protein